MLGRAPLNAPTDLRKNLCFIQSGPRARERRPLLANPPADRFALPSPVLQLGAGAANEFPRAYLADLAEASSPSPATPDSPKSRARRVWTEVWLLTVADC